MKPLDNVCSFAIGPLPPPVRSAPICPELLEHALGSSRPVFWPIPHCGQDGERQMSAKVEWSGAGAEWFLRDVFLVLPLLPPQQPPH